MVIKNNKLGVIKIYWSLYMEPTHNVLDKFFKMYGYEFIDYLLSKDINKTAWLNLTDSFNDLLIRTFIELLKTKQLKAEIRIVTILLMPIISMVHTLTSMLKNHSFGD